MRAVICRAWGEVDGLKVEEVAAPTPGPDDVLIAVKATAVNYADALITAGRYQTKPDLPFSPGLETAGVVASCGSRVTRLKPGDRVMAILAYGGLAEMAVAPASETFAMPSRMSFEEAGAVPVAYISRHVAIPSQGRLEPREPAPGQEPGRHGHVAPLLPLARAGQAPLVGRRAPALVRGRQAPAVHLAPASAREERRGDPAPDRSPGVRQGGRRPGLDWRLSVEIQVREHGRHVVVLTIDNPPRLNAMSRQMMADLARLWDELDRGSCRCVVLTGAGTRAFCAGADMSGDLSAAPETAKVVSHSLLKHHVFSKPIVAAVNGDCVGGGVELLLSTDVRAPAPHARFGLPEGRWAI